MTGRIEPTALKEIREAIASLPADVSTDAIGTQAPKLQELYAPETHAVALAPSSPIVLGARGTGKSFWAGVLGRDDLRAAAATAYPKLGLNAVSVQFGYTGIGGPEGISRDKLDRCVSKQAEREEAKTFFWATILRALRSALKNERPRLPDLLAEAGDVDRRERVLDEASRELGQRQKLLLIVYDALDTMATSWPRRRLLTQSLLEVVWDMRAYSSVRVKLFLRPDQLDDDGLQFVELPKLRSGAVRLSWSGIDLYGLLFSRLSFGSAQKPFHRLLSSVQLESASQQQILARRWELAFNIKAQQKAMTALCGPFMAGGEYGYKKGKTYDWPLKHLGDAFDQVTPRSFLGLMIEAARYGEAPSDRAFTPRGIQHGLRAASKTRVDQLHQEFPWIKGVLTPLAGLLLPQEEKKVFAVWERADTLKTAMDDAKSHGYLPPVEDAVVGEAGLYWALERIGVMMRRKDERIDMPDLFRVAAKLLKKGGTAPR